MLRDGRFGIRVRVEALLGGRPIELPESTRHYLRNVRRLGQGDRIMAFDGVGGEAQARLVERDGVLDVELTEVPRRGLASQPVTLCYALPKGEKLKLVLRQIAELGVERIVLLNAERSVPCFDDRQLPGKRERWIRILSEAVKQSGGATEPTLLGPVSLTAAIEATAAAIRWTLHPDGGVSPQEAPIGAALALFVGPEGGFCCDEIAMLDAAGSARVCLGRRTLRTETAATVACALALQRLDMRA